MPDRFFDASFRESCNPKTKSRWRRTAAANSIAATAPHCGRSECHWNAAGCISRKVTGNRTRAINLVRCIREPAMAGLPSSAGVGNATGLTRRRRRSTRFAPCRSAAGRRSRILAERHDVCALAEVKLTRAAGIPGSPFVVYMPGIEVAGCGATQFASNTQTFWSI